MSRSIHQFFPRTKAGNTIPGAEYTVKNAVSGIDVDIFDSADSEAPKTQPYKADGNGKVLFYIEPGIYNIDSTDLKTGNTGSKIDVPIGVSRREIDDNNGVKQFDKTYATVADIKADTSLQANSSKLINTVDYYSTQRGGGASYLIKTVAQAAADGDVIDGWGSHALANGNVSVIQGEQFNPEQFGCITGGESSAPLQAFFDYARVMDKICNPVGSFLINNKIEIFGSKRDVMIFDLTLEAVAELGQYAVSWDRDGKIGSHKGKLSIKSGSRPVLYENRLYDYALYVINAAREVLPDFIQVESSRIDGISFDSDRGNTSGVVLGKIRAFENGFNDEVSFSNLVNTGSLGSGNQGTEIDVGFVPSFYQRPALDFLGFALLGGVLHGITDITGSTVSLYPRSFLSDASSGSVHLFIGAGVHIVGADANIMNIDYIDGAGNAILFHDAALYPQQLNTLVTQSNGIGFVLGQRQDASSVGGFINRMYCEDNDFDIVRATRSPTQYDIKTLNPSDTSKWTGTPGAIAGVGDSFSFEEFTNISIGNSGQTLTSDNTSQTIKNGGNLNILTNTVNLVLDLDEKLLDLFNKNHVSCYVVGTGASNSFSNPISVTSLQGDLVNGQASISIDAGLPVKIECVYRESNSRWYVNWFRVEAIS